MGGAAVDEFLRWAWAPAAATVTAIIWAIRTEGRTKKNTADIQRHDEEIKQVWSEFKEINTGISNLDKNTALIAQSMEHNRSVAEETQKAVRDHAVAATESNRRTGERLEELEKAVDRLDARARGD